MIKGSDENVKLITNIVNECDIDKSLLYVLALMSQRYEELATFATPLTNGRNTYEYLCKKAMTTLPTLDTLVGVWQGYCEEKGVSPAQGQKFLAKEYIPPPKYIPPPRQKWASGGKLNPKKRRV